MRHAIFSRPLSLAMKTIHQPSAIYERTIQDTIGSGNGFHHLNRIDIERRAICSSSNMIQKIHTNKILLFKEL